MAEKGALRHGEAPFLLSEFLAPLPSFPMIFFVYIACHSPSHFSGPVMLRKYGWLLVFAVFMFVFEGLLMQWIELMSTESEKCRNMNSVNPLKLVNCTELG
jgi:hypothetical protein